jgi:site-specific DNA-methyltransferase (adenine-specific)
MEYLIKLVSKENAVILDPFLGSGTTAIACLKLNRNFIGIEKESDYVKIAEARIKPYLSQTKLNKEAVSIPPNPKGIGYP